MTLQQTIDIPADRRVHFDWTLPETASVGPATVILEFSSDGIPKNMREKIALERVRKQQSLLKPGENPLLALGGSCKGLVPEKEELENKRLDKLIEEEHEIWLHSQK
jgi:hypothetical protein